MNGGRWRWESTPKIHSDFDFAMNEVLYFVLLFFECFCETHGTVVLFYCLEYKAAIL